MHEIDFRRVLGVTLLSSVLVTLSGCGGGESETAADAGGPGGANPHKTAHYALCTGFMALGMMLPGMVSGWLQAQLGYLSFFIWACVATLPSFLAAGFIRIDPGFGREADSRGAS